MSFPISAAHLLISEPRTDDEWHTKTFPALRLDAVDHLVISPFIVGPEGHFILENEAQIGPRVKAVVKATREHARKTGRTVKIFGMQFWGTTGIFNLTTDKMKQNYASTVPQVLAKYDLDGYDIDYEWNDESNGNLVPFAPKLLHDIRQALDDLGKQSGRKYYVGITPATPAYLHPHNGVHPWQTEMNHEAKEYPVTKSVDFVNIQTYDGGFSASNTVQAWIHSVGFKPSQILFGIVSEENQDASGKRPKMPTIPQAIAGYQNGGDKLAGIFLWRLNGNTTWSNQVQPVLYNWLHGKNLVSAISLAEAEAQWVKNTA